MLQHHPYVTVILAMSADGKIADFKSSAARFGSKFDKAHLEKQIAVADAVLLGAGTLRAYGTTLTVSNPNLLQHREKTDKPLQPLHIVITESANLNPEIRFFQQPVRRWLLTTQEGANFWRKRWEFERIFTFAANLGNEQLNQKINITAALAQFKLEGIDNLAVLGGGKLVAAMFELDLVDELWLTVCPLVLGGEIAPTPVAGNGFLENFAPRLELLEVKTVENEVFLHYRVVGRKEVNMIDMG
ncbi:RibD family protein [Calothrix sp. UHCC 0171]|uniref:RibD family protein n=1 Tax=Calothrix sp. UHCC 0171 TaxID=3110245 RepID=UPI002B20CA30|nr:RibD family protein [Calothrix sp. UHCC 0171]MEA5570707.1 RibD family protein [Calothrix sp. UHCC 0171]